MQYLPGHVDRDREPNPFRAAELEGVDACRESQQKTRHKHPNAGDVSGAWLLLTPAEYDRCLSERVMGETQKPIRTSVSERGVAQWVK